MYGMGTGRCGARESKEDLGRTRHAMGIRVRGKAVDALDRTSGQPARVGIEGERGARPDRGRVRTGTETGGYGEPGSSRRDGDPRQGHRP